MAPRSVVPIEAQWPNICQRAHLRAVQHLERPFLHAARLTFRHPEDGRSMEFSSELPSDLQRVLDTFEFLDMDAY